MFGEEIAFGHFGKVQTESMYQHNAVVDVLRRIEADLAEQFLQMSRFVHIVGIVDVVLVFHQPDEAYSLVAVIAGRRATCIFHCYVEDGVVAHEKVGEIAHSIECRLCVADAECGLYQGVNVFAGVTGRNGEVKQIV